MTTRLKVTTPMGVFYGTTVKDAASNTIKSVKEYLCQINDLAHINVTDDDGNEHYMSSQMIGQSVFTLEVLEN